MGSEGKITKTHLWKRIYENKIADTEIMSDFYFKIFENFIWISF